MTPQSLQKMDHAAIKTNQLMIISLSILAFVSISTPCSNSCRRDGRRGDVEKARLRVCVSISPKTLGLDEAGYSGR